MKGGECQSCLPQQGGYRLKRKTKRKQTKRKQTKRKTKSKGGCGCNKVGGKKT